MALVPAAPSPTGMAEAPYRVMVVEDSLVIRGLIARMLESDPRITVVTTVANGQQAIGALGRFDVEIVVLDIQMPVMDGLTALPLLIKADPHLQVIMASTLTRRNAEVSLRALAAGAADYVAKPTSSREVSGAVEFRRELLDKVLALGARRRRLAPRPVSRPQLAAAPRQAGPPASPALRPPPKRVPSVIAIGSSTGGPQALIRILGALGVVPQPILITQHMPATFTTILAEHIARAAAMPCAEAVHGEALRGGRIYLAPGDWHMTVAARDGAKVIELNQDARENFCRPAVDPMLRSLARACGDGTLAVILTGMGHDGLAGGRAVADAGGRVIAQDEASSVVWGMPGAVARAGLCSEILPLGEMAARLGEIARGSAG